MIILDSDVISALMRATPDPPVVSWLDLQPRSSVWTTTINVFEIRFGLQSMPKGKRQETLIENFNALLDKLEHRVAAFDLAAADMASALMAARKQKGRTVGIRDTMIAGIALAHHATLVTRNTSDFADTRVPLVNPWS